MKALIRTPRSLWLLDLYPAGPSWHVYICASCFLHTLTSIKAWNTNSWQRPCDLNGSGDGNTLVEDPTIQQGHLVLSKLLVKRVCQKFHCAIRTKMEVAADCLMWGLKAIHERCLPLTRQQLWRAEPAGGWGLISSGWNTAAQRRTCVSVSQDAAAEAAAAAAAMSFLFWFCHSFSRKKYKWWGPVMEREENKA